MERLKFWSEDRELSIGKENPSLFDLLKTCKEVIFDWVDEKPIFHLISLQIDFEAKTAKHGHLWSTTVNFDSLNDQDQEVKTIIAYAITLELPVYPNSPVASEKLIPYWKDVLINGFEAPHEDDSVRLVLSDDEKKDLIDLDSYLNADFSRIRTPVELQIQRTFIQKEFEKLSQANKVLKLLELSIRQLSEKLEKTQRNENELQRCLTENPILFGLDYLRVIPKHQLGSEYEMDYALERINGVYDLIEIEASNLPLYTKERGIRHNI